VSGPDLAASVRQRLLNQSRAQSRPFQELLQYFAMERFLYRLAKSPYADRFTLKGALLLTAWRAPLSRPTMDIDLAGQTNNQLDHIKEVVGTVCELGVDPDGVQFNRGAIEVSRIKEDADYEGVRVQFDATLAKARIPMQLDIGFGDVITPGPTGIEYPTLLNFPAPVLRAYPRETVVAEKLEALTALGLLNSRMKDFYDLALLFRLYPFEGQRFWEPVSATFRHRGTAIEPEPIGLTQAYSDDPARAIQWRAFVRRSRFGEEAGDLARLIGEIRSFALPVLSAVATGNPFGLRWKPGGPWE
jgi:predicted nucleotidyltransferase component of viral defense system